MSAEHESDVRRRPLHKEKEGEDAHASGEKQEAETAYDWGVDDEGWTRDADEPETPAERRKSILRRTQGELTLAFAFHLIVMCLYIYIHVYDATVLKRTGGKGFAGAETYGGRWKYLTYINLWLQFIYYFLSFFADIMPRSVAKKMCQDICDFYFNTLAFPMATFVALAFWGIYAINRELVYPASLDEYIPQLLNHYWHTMIVVFVTLESLLVFHRFPSTNKSVAVIFAFSTGYIVWSSIVRINVNRWAYPFLNAMPPPLISVFYVLCFFFTLGFYFLGKKMAYIRFGARHRLMEKLGI